MLTSFKEMMQKVVNICLKFSIIVWDIYFCCFRSYYLFYNILVKIQVQDLTTKEFKPKKSWLKNLKPIKKKIFTLSYTNYLKKISYNKKKNIFKKIEIKKILFWALKTISLRQKRKKITENIIIAKKKQFYQELP